MMALSSLNDARMGTSGCDASLTAPKNCTLRFLCLAADHPKWKKRAHCAFFFSATSRERYTLSSF
jgi:hypothetical protein